MLIVNYSPKLVISAYLLEVYAIWKLSGLYDVCVVLQLLNSIDSCCLQHVWPGALIQTLVCSRLKTHLFGLAYGRAPVTVRLLEWRVINTLIHTYIHAFIHYDSAGRISSSSSYFILQHNIKQIIITAEYKNMPENCQRSKRSLNWPSVLYNNIITNDKRKRGTYDIDDSKVAV